MSDHKFTQYRRKQVAELRPYTEGEDVSHVSISSEDTKAGSPKHGDMIARNPKNHADQWLVARAYFLDNFEALTAAEQAEPAPAARSGAVKVKQLEWESIDGGNAFRAPALIFGWIRIETYTLHSWQVQWSVPGICNLLMPNVFDSPSAAKAAAQADYERRILAALEPAEPATDAEPYTYFYRYSDPMSGKPVWRSSGGLWNGQRPSETLPLYTHPPEPKGNAQPWGYWVKHKYAEGGFLRTPCFTPKADYYTDVVPLFTHPPESRVHEEVERIENLIRSDKEGEFNALGVIEMVKDMLSTFEKELVSGK